MIGAEEARRLEYIILCLDNRDAENMSKEHTNMTCLSVRSKELDGRQCTGVCVSSELAMAAIDNTATARRLRVAMTVVNKSFIKYRKEY